MLVTLYERGLFMHADMFLTSEKIGGPIAKIEEDKRERKSDTRDEIDPCATFRVAGPPFLGQEAPAAPLGT